MSKQTWLEEFYPIPADKCKGSIAAIEHSLRKWEGALPENLAKHMLIRAPIDYDDSTCSLCIKYYNDDLVKSLHYCWKCPIYKANDWMSCGGAYRSYYSSGDPQPMIDLLKKTLEFYRDKKKKSAAKKEKTK